MSLELCAPLGLAPAGALCAPTAPAPHPLSLSAEPRKLAAGGGSRAAQPLPERAKVRAKALGGQDGPGVCGDLGGPNAAGGSLLRL